MICPACLKETDRLSRIFGRCRSCDDKHFENLKRAELKIDPKLLPAKEPKTRMPYEGRRMGHVLGKYQT